MASGQRPTVSPEVLSRDPGGRRELSKAVCPGNCMTLVLSRERERRGRRGPSADPNPRVLEHIGQTRMRGGQVGKHKGGEVCYWGAGKAPWCHGKDTLRLCSPEAGTQPRALRLVHLHVAWFGDSAANRRRCPVKPTAHGRGFTANPTHLGRQEETGVTRSDQRGAGRPRRQGP